MDRDKFVSTLDGYLAQGYTIHSVGGGAGDDWRELKIVLRRPVIACQHPRTYDDSAGCYWLRLRRDGAPP